MLVSSVRVYKSEGIFEVCLPNDFVPLGVFYESFDTIPWLHYCCSSVPKFVNARCFWASETDKIPFDTAKYTGSAAWDNTVHHLFVEVL